MEVHFHFGHHVSPVGPPASADAKTDTGSADEPQRTFLVESIKDIQGVVRGIDFKINVLLVLLSVPLLHITEIMGCIIDVHTKHPQIGIFLYVGVTLIAILWSIAWWIALMALFGNYNPAALVKSTGVTGAFYCPGAYHRMLQDLFARPKCVSPLSLQELHDRLPRDSASVNRELSFEVLKLALIRDIKHYRYSRASACGLIALGAGVAAYCVSRLYGWI